MIQPSQLSSGGDPTSEDEPALLFLVEDNPGDAELLKLSLSDAGAEFEIRHLTTVAACVAAMGVAEPQLVLLDLSLPDAEGLDGLRRIVAAGRTTAVVVVTGSSDTSLALSSLREGAQDFCIKDELSPKQLLRSVNYAVARKQVQMLQGQLANVEQATTQMLHSERLAVLGELAASVAHELNQPLNGIKLISQAALRELSTTEHPELAEDLGEIATLVDTMAATIDLLRRFSTRGIEAETHVDINGVIRDALKLMGQRLRDEGIDLAQDLAPDLPSVVGHSVHYGQVVLNLMTNAADSLAQKIDGPKRLRLTTRLQPEQGADARHVVLEVRDNGIGIPEGQRRRIFQPFMTTKPPGKGSGLGLAITAQIVGTYQGGVEVVSEEEGDTVFRVSFKVARSPSATDAD